MKKMCKNPVVSALPNLPIILYTLSLNVATLFTYVRISAVVDYNAALIDVLGQKSSFF
jgi:hypothetical protein